MTGNKTEDGQCRTKNDGQHCRGGNCRNGKRRTGKRHTGIWKMMDWEVTDCNGNDKVND